MFSGQVHQGRFCQIRLTMLKTILSVRISWLFGRKVLRNLLKAYDFSDEEIEDLLEKRLELDRRIAAVVLSNEESSEYAKLYHPYAYEDFKKFAPALPLDDFFQAVIGQTPDKVIVDEERFWQAADQFYSEEAWPLLKATFDFGCGQSLNQLSNWRDSCFVRCLRTCPFRCSRSTGQGQGSLSLGPRSFQASLGLWYAHEKFSPEAKADVEKKSSDYDWRL